jgi:hypothetical protein
MLGFTANPKSLVSTESFADICVCGEEDLLPVSELLA